MSSFGLVWHMWWLAILGVLTIIAAVIARSFARDVHRIVPAAEVERIESTGSRGGGDDTDTAGGRDESANQGLAEMSG